MRRLSVLYAVVLMLSLMGISFGTLYSNDFESYADSNELYSAFLYFNGTITLETIDFHSGAQAMRWDFNNGVEPYYSYASFSSAPDVDWSSADLLSLAYKVVAGGTEYIRVRMLTDEGATVVGDFFYDGVNPAPVGDWIVWDIDISSIAEADKSNIDRLDILMLAGSYGSGTLLVDDIAVTPEPATVLLFSLGGGLLLRRRK